MEAISLRYLERILTVALAGLSIYLGYRLFINLPDKTDSHGKIILPGNISVYLSRVGPGTFFALFGAAVLALSLYKGITYQKSITPVSGTADSRHGIAAESGSKEYFAGAIPDQISDNDEDRAIRRSHLRPRLRLLNQLPAMLNPDLDPGKRADIINALPAIKISLLETVWGPDWGDFPTFEKWALQDTGGDPPPDLEAAAQMFRYGAAADR